MLIHSAISQESQQKYKKEQEKKNRKLFFWEGFFLCNEAVFNPVISNAFHSQLCLYVAYKIILRNQVN